jgi:hypothetical protein
MKTEMLVLMRSIVESDAGPDFSCKILSIFPVLKPKGSNRCVGRSDVMHDHQWQLFTDLQNSQRQECLEKPHPQAARGLVQNKPCKEQGLVVRNLSSDVVVEPGKEPQTLKKDSSEYVRESAFETKAVKPKHLRFLRLKTSAEVLFFPLSHLQSELCKMGPGYFRTFLMR